MEPVAPNAGVRIPARQGEGLSERRLSAVKRRIETRNLGNLRNDIHDCADGGEIVRLMSGANGVSFLRSSRTLDVTRTGLSYSRPP